MIRDINHGENMMQDREIISEKKLEKLAKHLAKSLHITSEEAMDIIYEEWDLVEELFAAHKKAKAVKEHLSAQLNSLYKTA